MGKQNIDFYYLEYKKPVITILFVLNLLFLPLHASPTNERVVYSYDNQGYLQIKEIITDDHTIMMQYSYDFLNHITYVEEEVINHEKHQTPQIQENSWFSFSTVWQGIKDIGFFFSETLNSFKNHASYSNYMKDEWNAITEEFFDKSYLQLGGYYLDPMERGSSLGKEMNDKIRVTLINGILNIHSDLETLLKMFSSSHGDIPIHYVFRPTEGLTKDILTSSLSKMGYTTPYAELLAETWKELIEEMGGVGKGGKIIHYAHSIGATDTYTARNLLTVEEQQMIQLITFGSPTMIPNNSGFYSVTNYVSKRDGVCLLDPIGYFMGAFYGESKIEFLDSYWGVPLIDHTLYTTSYGEIIKELGVQFIHTYQSSIQPSRQ